MCIAFFEGKGYSAEFIGNMHCVIEALRKADPEVELFIGADVICAACPNNIGGICREECKVSGYDKAVLELTGLKEGSTLHWSEFFNEVHRSVIWSGKLSYVCGDCRWSSICGTDRNDS